MIHMDNFGDLDHYFLPEPEDPFKYRWIYKILMLINMSIQFNLFSNYLSFMSNSLIEIQEVELQLLRKNY